MDPTPSLQRYVLVQVLGTGGMGELWQGRCSYPGGHQGDCVLKFVRSDYCRQPDYIERFAHEALIGLEVSAAHPNIVTTRGFEAWPDGRHFIVLDRVDGHTIGELLPALHGHYPVIRRIATDMLSALEYLESRGVIHGDVSPANILVSSEGRAMLTDFGLARRVTRRDQAVTIPGFGALPYVSPEVLRDRRATFASDRYSLGFILYEAATGSHPVAPDRSTVRHPSRLHFPPDVPPDLQAVIAGLLCDNPQERMTSRQARLLLAEREDHDKASSIAGDRSRARRHDPKSGPIEITTSVAVDVPAAMPRSLPARRHRPFLGSAIVATAASALTAVIVLSLTYEPRHPAPSESQVQVIAAVDTAPPEISVPAAVEAPTIEVDDQDAPTMPSQQSPTAVVASMSSSVSESAGPGRMKAAGDMDEQPRYAQVPRVATTNGISVRARILGGRNQDMTIHLTLYSHREAGFKLASATVYTPRKTLNAVMSGKPYLAPYGMAEVGAVVAGVPRGTVFELLVTDETETTIIIDGLTAP